MYTTLVVKTSDSQIKIKYIGEIIMKKLLSKRVNIPKPVFILLIILWLVLLLAVGRLCIDLFNAN